jgi:RNA polymerase sigma factor (TIGR02999 family)
MAFMPDTDPLSRDEINQILSEARQGDKQSLDRLMPIIYTELRRLAHSYVRNERPDRTVQTTALVNEAYIRLVDYRMHWQGRAHFFAIAAQAMRRILVEQARKRRSTKRGGDAHKVSLDDAAPVSRQRAEDVIAVEDALTKLEEIDPRRSRIVELRFYAGLSVEETAEVLGISAPTVKREWRAAKAWLYRVMNGEPGDDAGTLQAD